MLKAGIIAAVAVALAIGLATGTSAGTRHAQRAPRACTQAIHEARVLSYLASQGVGISEQLVPMIQDAAIAGANQDAAALSGIAKKLTVIAKKISHLATTYGQHGDRFNNYAANCK